MSMITYESAASLPRVARRWPLLWGAVAAVVVVLTLASWQVFKHLGVGTDDPLSPRSASFVRIAKAPLDVVIRKDGEIQSIHNIDLVCNVEGMNAIRAIVPEGTFVKKDDVVAEIDSSEIKRKLQSALLDVKKAENDLTAAKEQRRIQESKNTADIEAARVELRLAQIDLRAYTEGDFPMKLGEATRTLEMSRITLKKQQQNLAQTRELFNKGFLTSTDMEKAQLDLVTAQNDFEKKTSGHRVLTEYTREKDLADKQNKVAQAEKKVARVESENVSNLSQKVADEQTKEQSLLIQRAALEHWQEQLEACTIKARGDGMVLYASSLNTMFYRESPIQVGAKIGEQQLLVRLPDTRTIKAVARIPEAQAAKLRVDKSNPMRATVKIVSSGQIIGAAVTSVSMLADNSMRWMNPDSKEYPVDLTLDRTPEGLKPGSSASVEIEVQRLDDALSVPLSSLYSIGPDQYAFVRDGSRVRPSKVSIGATNATHAEIKDGLVEGQEVLVLEIGQGQRILEAAGISTRQPVDSARTTVPAAIDAGATSRPTAVAPDAERASAATAGPSAKSTAQLPPRQVVRTTQAP